MDYYLDKTIQIKCLKEKKGNRTYIYGLYKYFNNTEECNLFSEKMKKFLATSMEIKDEDEEKKKKNEEEVNEEIKQITDEEKIKEEKFEECIENEDEISENNNSKKKRKKKKETTKKIIIIEKPIYTFRGDLIRKITDYLKNNLNDFDNKNIIS